MDDQDDRGYSRAPELEDLLKLCKALNAENVRYVLIGGFADILQGFVRGTKGIDLLVDASPENVRRLKRAMAVPPDNAIELIADDEKPSGRFVLATRPMSSFFGFGSPLSVKATDAHNNSRNL
ncbi:MAG TPA: hypothetical protein VHX14_04185 [Thermoanaerobaculia bacterium]|nr:hypothetical protein [Thermoanaerobaculia bacterium]